MNPEDNSTHLERVLCKPEWYPLFCQINFATGKEKTYHSEPDRTGTSLS